MLNLKWLLRNLPKGSVRTTRKLLDCEAGRKAVSLPGNGEWGCHNCDQVGVCFLAGPEVVSELDRFRDYNKQWPLGSPIGVSAVGIKVPGHAQHPGRISDVCRGAGFRARCASLDRALKPVDGKCPKRSCDDIARRISAKFSLISEI